MYFNLCKLIKPIDDCKTNFFFVKDVSYTMVSNITIAVKQALKNSFYTDILSFIRAVKQLEYSGIEHFPNHSIWTSVLLNLCWFSHSKAKCQTYWSQTHNLTPQPWWTPHRVRPNCMGDK